MPLKGSAELLATLAIVGQLGFIMVGSIGGGLLAGVYLDRWLGSAPLLTIVLLFSGIGGGMATAYCLVMKTVSGKRKEGSPPGHADGP